MGRTVKKDAGKQGWVAKTAESKMQDLEEKVVSCDVENEKIKKELVLAESKVKTLIIEKQLARQLMKKTEN